ncbi:hypothetical protein [Nocardia flavorosea]|uniref:Uncharacterized protein n=1 Tax=Nocardia flavorosea TaxID=53429 RepID=A0A846YHV2_9NOCA|nr:hypothetical protein [Nocardia flavorosea]NKY57401.1 hypothetical protein [Nocardia flavorosea]
MTTPDERLRPAVDDVEDELLAGIGDIGRAESGRPGPKTEIGPDLNQTSAARSHSQLLAVEALECARLADERGAAETADRMHRWARVLQSRV